MDELTLLAGREENPSPAGITDAAATAALATCVLFFASAVSEKTGICGWFTPGSDAAKVVLLGEVEFTQR
jgi:hypothetical protein